MSLFLMGNAAAAPGINAEIPFFGTLKDSVGAEQSGTFDMVFRFYDASTGGTLLDTSIHTAANGNPVTVSAGEFNILLGSGTGNALDGLDFNDDSIFIGITIGTDSEMTPRQQLGASPYAFNADTVDGKDASDFLQQTATGTLATSSLDTLFTINQQGSGDILNLLDNGTEVLTVLDGGMVGIGTSSPSVELDVWGNFRVGTGSSPAILTNTINSQVAIGTDTFNGTSALTVGGVASVVDLLVQNSMAVSNQALFFGTTTFLGPLADGLSSAGSAGQVLQTTGTGVRWVATSTLGLGGGGGATTLAGLTDTSVGSAASGDLLSYNGSNWINLATSSLNLSLTDTTGTLGETRGGTGQTTYTTGDILYASGANTLTKLAVGGDGTVLKVAGGVPTWGTDISGSGGGSGLFATTTNNDVIFPVDVTDILVVGASATSSTGFQFEVVGDSLFDGATFSAATTAILSVGNTLNIASATSGISFAGEEMLFASASTTSNFDNLFFGRNAGAALRGSGTGVSNIGIGFSTLTLNTTGGANVAVGDSALSGNLSGNQNIALGSSALLSNTVGSLNTAVGPAALIVNSSGSENTAFGHGALALNNGTGTIGIGYSVANNAASVDRGIFIGHSIDAFSTTEDNVLNIGNIIFGRNIDGTGTTISSGNIGIGTSSPTSKLDVWGDFRVGTGSVPSLYVDSNSGFVGIGTTTPNNEEDLLTLYQATGNVDLNLVSDSSRNTQINFEERGDASWSITQVGSTNSLLFGNGSTLMTLSSDQGFRATIGTSSPTGDARFSVQSAGTNDILNLFETDGSEVFTVLENGNVGIGTSSPQSLLSLENGDVTVFGGSIELYGSGGTLNTRFNESTGNSIAQIQFIGGNGAIAANDSLQLAFRADATGSDDFFSIGIDGDGASEDTELLRLTQAGDLGIGTTSPASRLDVWGDLRVGTSSVPQLFVDTNAQFAAVGRSTTLNNAAFTVEGDSAAVLSLVRSSVGDSAALNFSQSGSGNPWSLDTTQAITFNPGNSELVRLTSGGRVGIGTTSPDSVLAVTGSTTIVGSNSQAYDWTLNNAPDSALLRIGLDNNGNGLIISEPTGGTPDTYFGVYDEFGSIKLEIGDDVLTTGANVRMSIPGTLTAGEFITVTASTTDRSIFGSSASATPAMVITDVRSDITTDPRTTPLMRFAYTNAPTIADSLAGFSPFNTGTNRGLSLMTYNATSSSFVENLTLLDTGFVGIGTSSPSEALAVTGNINLTGNLMMDGQTVFQQRVSPDFELLVGSGASAGGFRSLAIGTDADAGNGARALVVGSNSDANDFAVVNILGTDSDAVASFTNVIGSRLNGYTDTATSNATYIGFSDNSNATARSHSLYLLGQASSTFNEVTLFSAETRWLDGENATRRSQVDLNVYDSSGDLTFLQSGSDGANLITALNPSGGFVGIGTTTPINATEDALSIYRAATNPVLRINTDSGRNASIEFNEIGTGGWSIYQTGSNDTLQFRYGAQIMALMTDQGRRVSIGTTSPIGNARFAVQSVGTNDVLNLFETDGQEVFTVLESGNVGIGTTSPSRKLTVAGDAFIGSDFTATGTIAFTGLTSALLQADSAGVLSSVATSSLGLGDGTFRGLVDTPGAYTANALIFASSTGGELVQSGNLTFDGTTFETGSIVSNGTLTVADSTSTGTIADIRRGATYLSNSITEPIVRISELGDSANSTFSSNLLSVERDPVSIVLSTTLTGSLVSFSDDCSTFGGTCSSSADVLRLSQNFADNTGTVLNLTSATTNGGDLFRVNDDGTFTDTTPFLIDQDGSVGIGTTSPSRKLTVAGDAFIGSDLTATGTITFSGLSAGLVQSNGSGVLSNIATSSLNLSLTDTTGTLGETRGGTGQTTYTTGDILYASGANTLTKLAVGGDGTVLKVAGGVPTWGTDISGSGGGSGLFATTTNNDVIFPVDVTDILVVGASATSSTGFQFEVVGDSLFDGAVFSGNVGIGSSSPSVALTVDGRLSVATGTFASPSIRFNNSGTTGFYSASPGSISFASGGANRSFWDGNKFQFNLPVLTASAGSAGTPQFGHNTDSDTGLYLPTGDILHLVTGGTEQLSIAGGNVGIGTTSPGSKLDVWGDFQVGTGSVPRLFVNDGDGFVGLGTSTAFSSNDVLNVYRAVANPTIRVIADANRNAGISLSETDSGNSWALNRLGASDEFNISYSGTRHMVFDPNGNIGIGTTSSPQGSNVRLSIQALGTSDVLNLFEGGGQEIFTVRESGSVGIGSTSPSSQLTVESNGDTELFVGVSGATQVASLRLRGQKNTLDQLVSEISFEGDGIDTPQLGNIIAQRTTSSADTGGKLLLTSNGGPTIEIGEGSVGIGDGSSRANDNTDAMLYLVDQQSALMDFYIDSNNSVSGQTGEIRFFNDGIPGAGTQVGALGYDEANDVFTLSRGALTDNDFNITAAGNIGVGTSSPSRKLTVAGDAFIGSDFTATGTIAFTGLTSGLLQADSAGVLSSVATSSLGLGDGTFLGLSDTPGSYGAERIFFTNAGGDAVTTSSDLSFDGVTLSARSLSLTGSLTMASAGNIALGSNFLSGDGNSEGIYVEGDGSGGIRTGATTNFDVVADDNNNQTGQNAAIRFFKDGIDGVGDLEGSIGYNGVSDVFTLSHGAITDNHFSIADTGNIGIGTTTPAARLTVAGSILGGNLTATGTVTFSSLSTGLVQSDSSGVLSNIATSSLGVGDGTFLGLSDTQSSFTANRLLFTNSGGTAVTDTAGLTFDGTTFTAPTTTFTGGLTLTGAVGDISRGLTFGDGDTGIYEHTDNELRIRIGGGTRWILDDQTIRSSNGNGARIIHASTPSTASSPLFSRGGDTDTGLFIPTIADELGLTTGGTTRLYIDADGDVGIGVATSSQTAKLSVGGTINIDDPNSGLQIEGVRVFYASTTNDSIAIGENAGANFTTTAVDNIAIGLNALGNATSSIRNVAIGHNAGQSITSGVANTLIGSGEFTAAGRSLTTGNNNTVVGSSAGAALTTGAANSFFGVSAGQSLSNTSAQTNNSFFGHLAGWRLTSGNVNSFFGRAAGQNLATSSASVIIGQGAVGGNSATDASIQNLTILGTDAGSVLGDGADNNILIGYRAGDELTTGQNNIVIGYDIDTPTTTSSNTLNIGNLLFGTGLDGADYTLSSGNIGIGTTSPASKLDVWGDFRVGTSGTPTLFVDTSEDWVGIGTTSPFVNGGGSLRDNFTVYEAGGNPRASIVSDNGFNSSLNFAEQGDASTWSLGRNGATDRFSMSYSGVPVFSSFTSRNTSFGSTTFDGAKLSVQTSDTTDILNLFETGGTEVFTVLEGGQVGIGTTTPNESLNVVGRIRTELTSSGDPYLHLVPDSGVGDSWMLGVDDNGNKLSFGYGLSGGTTPFGTTADKLTIDASGNVGVGTSSAASILHIDQFADSNGLQINGFDDVGGSSVYLNVDSAGNGRLTADESINIFSGDSFGGNLGSGATAGLAWDAFNQVTITAENAARTPLEILAAASQTATVFAVTSSDGSAGDLFTLDASGNVGIGTTSPNTTLSVDGGILATERLTLASGASASTTGRLVVTDNSVSTIWNQIGTGLSISNVGSPAITTLSPNRIAFIDSTNDDLRVYEFDGSTWSEVGTELNITGIATANITTLSPNRIAFIDNVQHDLRVYEFDGSSWSEVGTELNIPSAGTADITTLSPNRIAFSDGLNEDIRVYEFDGGTWSLVGTEFSFISANANQLTTLSPNRIAFIESISDDLRVYEFDGTNWSQVGSDLNISGVGFSALTTLSPNRVAFIDQDNDDLRVYEFDGSSWSEVGTELNISGVGLPNITTLSPNRIAFIDNDNDDLRVYQFSEPLFFAGTDAGDEPFLSVSEAGHVLTKSLQANESLQVGVLSQSTSTPVLDVFGSSVLGGDLDVFGTARIGTESAFIETSDGSRLGDNFVVNSNVKTNSYGFLNYVEKTYSTTTDDDFDGFHNTTVVNMGQIGSHAERIEGMFNKLIYNNATGTTGSMSGNFDLIEIDGETTANFGGIVGSISQVSVVNAGSASSVTGVSGLSLVSGSTTNPTIVNEVVGVHGLGYIQAATIATRTIGVHGDVSGFGAATSTDAFALYGTYGDLGGTPSNIINGYGLYLGDVVGQNQFGIYQSGFNDVNILAGTTVIGSTTASDYVTGTSTLDVFGTLRVGTSSVNYLLTSNGEFVGPNDSVDPLLHENSFGLFNRREKTWNTVPSDDDYAAFINELDVKIGQIGTPDQHVHGISNKVHYDNATGTEGVEGILNTIFVSNTGSEVTNFDWLYGQRNTVNFTGTSTATNVEGVDGTVLLTTGALATTTVGVDSYTGLITGAHATSAFGFRTFVQDFSGSTVDTGYGLYANVGLAGVMNTGYGVYIDDTTAVNDFGIYQAGSDDVNFFAGTVQVGTTSTTSRLTVAGEIDITASDGGISFAGTRMFYASSTTGGVFNTIAIGDGALDSLTSGIANIGIGRSALTANTSGTSNLALGDFTLDANTSGGSNMGLGTQVLSSNTVGSNNIGLGSTALGSNTTGGQNVAIGSLALFANNGSGTIAIGHNAADNVTGVDRGIFIGHGIDAQSTTEDEVLNIGNLIFGQGLDGTGTTLSSGGIAIGTSSASGARLTIQSQGTTDILSLFETDGTEVLTVLENGDVGIGTSSPAGRFAVGLGANETALFTDGANASAIWGTNIGLISELNEARVTTRGASTDLVFYTGGTINTMSEGTERMRIDALTGNVGIGTTSSNSKLTIDGSLFATEGLVLGGVGGASTSALFVVTDKAASNSWEQVGGDLNITGASSPALTTLSPNRVAFIDADNDDLRVYEFDGSAWSEVGTELALTGVGTARLTTLSPNRVAFIDQGNDDLRVYEFDGSAWSEVGTELALTGVGTPALTTLSPNRVAFIDGSNDNLRVYEFDGSTWSQVGGDLNISGAGTPALTTLSPNRVAFIDSFNDDLRVYEFDGNSWNQVGSDLPISGVNATDLTTLSPNRIAFIDGLLDDLRVYEFDGSTWSEVGTELTLTGVGTPRLAALSPNRVAFIDSSNSDLRTYQFSESLFFAGTDAGDEPFLSVSDIGHVLAKSLLVNESLQIGLLSQATSTPVLDVFGDSVLGGTVTVGSTINSTTTSALSALGAVGIGTTTPSAQLHVTDTVRFSLFGSGTLTTDGNGNVTVSSDERLKNISGTFNRGIEALRGIEPIQYHWATTTGYDTTELYTGFSAQNIAEFIPEAVGEDRRGFYTLSDRPIVATLINATKEQQYYIDAIFATTTDELLITTTEDSLWNKMTELLSGFADGVLALVGIEAESVVTEELCLGEDCIQDFSDIASEVGEVTVVSVVPTTTLGVMDLYGEIVIEAEATSSIVTFEEAYDEDPTVILTPGSAIIGSWWTEEVSTTEFTVRLAEEQLEDVVFSWHSNGIAATREADTTSDSADEEVEETETDTPPESSTEENGGEPITEDGGLDESVDTSSSTDSDVLGVDTTEETIATSTDESIIENADSTQNTGSPEVEDDGTSVETDVAEAEVMVEDKSVVEVTDSADDQVSDEVEVVEEVTLPEPVVNENSNE